MKIQINSTDITLKYGFRALMIFERITGHALDLGGINDVVTFFYSCVLASGTDVTFNDFLDWLDDNEDKVPEFVKWLNDTVEAKTLKKAKETGEA